MAVHTGLYDVTFRSDEGGGIKQEGSLLLEKHFKLLAGHFNQKISFDVARSTGVSFISPPICNREPLSGWKLTARSLIGGPDKLITTN